MPVSGTIFEAIGGFEKVERLVSALYKQVSNHTDLIPIFPEDLTETARKQTLFLTQLFGGPPLYTDERGHPMLRRRHLPFEITSTRKKAWLSCMSKALIEENIPEPYRSTIFERLTKTAEHMVNTSELLRGESM